MKDGCPFCDYDGPSPILWERAGTFVIEPLNPVTPGHVIVIPEAHVPDAVADPWIAAQCMETAALWARRDFLPHDFNFITSTGVHATQTVMHLHLHVVPRREGDGLRLPWSDP